MIAKARLLPSPDIDTRDRLRPVDKVALAIEVLGAYARVRWLFRGRTVEELLASLRGGERGPGSADSNEALVTGQRLASAVTRTLRLLPSDTRCLMRSLVLTRLLARRGIRASLVIGVRPGERFGAHAWVEQAGTPLLPAYGHEFSRLVDL